jgi:hypothetical protein
MYGHLLVPMEDGNTTAQRLGKTVVVGECFFLNSARIKSAALQQCIAGGGLMCCSVPLLDLSLCTLALSTSADDAPYGERRVSCTCEHS